MDAGAVVTMENANERASVEWAPLEKEILCALLTGDDASLSRAARVSVCSVVHDCAYPQERLLPRRDDLDHLLQERLARVVWHALEINRDRAEAVIDRWMQELAADLRRLTTGDLSGLE